MNRNKKNLPRSGIDNVHKCNLCNKTFLNENNLGSHTTICKKYKNLLHKKDLKHEVDFNLKNKEYTDKIFKKKEKIKLLKEELTKYESCVVFPPLYLNSTEITVKNISEIDLSGICKAYNKNFKMYLSSQEYKLYMEFLNQPNEGLSGLNNLDTKEIKYYGNVGFALKLAEWISPDVYIEVVFWFEKCIDYFERRLKKEKTIVNMRTINVNGVNVEVRKADGYIDAVGLCRASGKYFSNYKKDKNTLIYLKSLAENTLIPIEELILINIQGKISTFVHKKVAIHLAYWISPKCFVEVSSQVETLDMEKLKKENQLLSSKFKDMNEKVIVAGKIAKDSIQKFNSFYNNKELNRDIKYAIDEMELNCALEISTSLRGQSVGLTDCIGRPFGSNPQHEYQDFIWVENRGVNSIGKYTFKYCSTKGRLSNELNKKDGVNIKNESIITTIINNSMADEFNTNNIILLLRCYETNMCNDKFKKYIKKRNLMISEDSFLFHINNIEDLFNFTHKLKKICGVNVKFNLLSNRSSSNTKFYREKPDPATGIELEIKILEEEIHKINNMFSSELVSYFDPPTYP